MSTHYYTIPQPPCECCKRPYERRHLGLYAGGWSFMFQGIDHIRSANDWRMELSQAGVEIEDEYRRRVAVDEFWEMVESSKTGKNYAAAYPDDEDSWIDSEGYSFTGRRFD